MKISYPGRSLAFDGTTVTLKSLRDEVSIPAGRVASIDLPSYLRAKMEMTIATTDGRSYKFPAAYQRGKLREFRDAVLAAQGQ